MPISRRSSFRKSESNLVQAANSSSRHVGKDNFIVGAPSPQHLKRRRSWCWRRTSSSSLPMCMPSPTSSPTSYNNRRRRLPFLLLDRLKSYIKRSNPIHVALFSILFTISLVYLLHLLIIREFGVRGSIKGGDMGNMLDQFVKDRTRYKTITKWRNEVQSQLHIPIIYKGEEGRIIEPWYYPLDVIIKTRPNSAVIEMLLREKRRVDKLGYMIQNSQKSCSRDANSQVDIPNTLIQLLPHHELPTLPPYWIVRSELIDIDYDYVAVQNSDIYSDTNNQLLKSIQSCQEIIGRSTAMQCLGYHLGGIQISNNHAELEQSRSDINTILTLLGKQSDKLLAGGNCKSRLGYAVFSNTPTPEEQLRKVSAISSHVSTTFAAFGPDNLMQLCIPPLENSIGISPYNEANVDLSYQSTFTNKLITEIESRSFNSTQVWGLATLTCDMSDINKDTITNCCNQVTVKIIDSVEPEAITKHVQNAAGSHHLIFTSSKTISDTPIQSSPVSVSISEPSNSIQPQRRHKESIQMKLRNDWNCEPSWWCNRCLMQLGSFSNCSSTCDECAINAICDKDGSDNTKRSQIKVDVQVTSFNTQQYRIPKIIHQTYFEEITMEKYPQLLRLQNTWKASGWEYRFYDDATAREYITTNYPPRFVSVFDALLPGAYKADFFRYLVLFKDGGVYVDVDVMLNTNLDTFITPDLAFFSPLDAVGTFADEQYCLWNGLLGSAPAHPALANVIEWMVNLVSNRGDMYDMEQTVCSFSGVDKLENWKIRAEPGLMLSGPCALGLAVNNALGNEPLSKFTSGLLTHKGYNTRKREDLNSDAIGNIMILAVDKSDLGAFRFNDPERNVMIASTDLQGLSKTPMVYEKSENLRGKDAALVKQKPHYSISTAGDKLWGTHDVYTDDLITEEVISLAVSYDI